jgi:beta-phosphoglucomutase-like phosphatase (HAD superfamily)
MPLQLPKAVIFDMDGTLINNYPFHLKAWQIICEKYGAPRSIDEIIKDLHGTNFEVCQNFFGKDITFKKVSVLVMKKRPCTGKFTVRT